MDVIGRSLTKIFEKKNLFKDSYLIIH